MAIFSKRSLYAVHDILHAVQEILHALQEILHAVQEILYEILSIKFLLKEGTVQFSESSKHRE